MTKPGRYIHGVGLLRVSRTPVTVDSEEYVIFFDGHLQPDCYASHAQALAQFEEWEARGFAPRRQRKRLRSAFHMKGGAKPMATEYKRARRIARVQPVT